MLLNLKTPSGSTPAETCLTNGYEEKTADEKCLLGDE